MENESDRKEDRENRNRKKTSLWKLKYRIRILGSYMLFSLLCVWVVQIRGSGSFYPDKPEGRTAVIILDNNSYIRDGVKFKKGDKIQLEITFPPEYGGKNIEVVYFDFNSGGSTILYEGNVTEVLRESFNVKEDGRGDFAVLADTGKKNITDQVKINYVLERSGDNKEEPIPVK